MRIIAGYLGGRIFQSPHGHRTHPMSDKMRGALFNMLGDVDGLSVLDAFSGSGALSFEAISREAATALAIESDLAAQKTISKNIEDLGLKSQISLVKASANAWLSTTDSTFDIILLDPPYNDLQLSLLKQLVTRLKSDGVVVLSWPGGSEAPIFDNLQQVAVRSYGDSQLIFYK